MFGYGFSYINLITGGIVVRAPMDVQVEQEEDKRPGFFGHAVLTISWNHSEGLGFNNSFLTLMYNSYSLCLRLL